jgi:hypothetical protein
MLRANGRSAAAMVEMIQAAWRAQQLALQRTGSR